MKVRFIYPKFERHAQTHPELLDHVPCNEYFGPPSLGIAAIAAVTPKDWDIEFRDDRFEDIGLDDQLDLVAISTFTPSAARAMEIADAFRSRGTKVVMGGIFPTMMPDIAGAHADAVVVGEGEGVWPDVLKDAISGTLRPRYIETEPANLETLPLPRVDLYVDKENGSYRPDDYPVQTSRGCAMSCFACVLPTSMGKRMRPFPVEHVLGQIDQLGKKGKLASLTEDVCLLPASGMPRKFGAVIDALAARNEPARVSYLGTSMPMILTTPDSLLDRMSRCGIKMFYLVGGFDPVTMNAFTGKDAKAYERAVESIKKSFDHGIEPYTSFLVGNESDDEGVFDRMLDFADKTGIRKAEFAILTPYPGTPIWKRFEEESRIIDRTWTHYNDANVVFRPKQMTPERLLEGYLYLWREFYRRRQSLRSLDREARTIQF